MPCRIARRGPPAVWTRVVGLVGLVGIVMGGTTGCVRRSLTIRTDPPGASIYVNDQLKGESPLTYDFMWYGWHRVALEKEGWTRLEDRQQLRAPPLLWIPFDLAMELLPIRFHDARTWSYTLSPLAVLPTPMPPTPEFDAVAPSSPSEGALPPVAMVPPPTAGPQDPALRAALPSATAAGGGMIEAEPAGAAPSTPVVESPEGVTDALP